MNATASGQTYVVTERFHRATALIHRALNEWELSVVCEFDATRLYREDRGNKSEPSKILLVDSSLLAFEAQALDRAALVFFPLHVFVGADGDLTRVSVASSSDLFDSRLPLGVASPMEKLQNRVSQALESVVAQSETDRMREEGE